MAANDASPQASNPVGLQGGRKRIIQDNFEVAAEDVTDIGDIIRLARVPSNARLISLQVGNDDLDGGGPTLAADLGLYNSATDDVVDVDAFASASTQLQAAAALTNLIDEALATAAKLTRVGNRVWEDAGLSADPGGNMDIAFTLTAAATTPAAGTIAFLIEYVVD